MSSPPGSSTPPPAAATSARSGSAHITSNRSGRPTARSTRAAQEGPRRGAITSVAFTLAGIAVTNVVLALVGSVVVGYSLDQAVSAYVVPQTIIGGSCAASGTLIAWQRPRNPVGWLLLSAGLLQTLTAATAPWLDLGSRQGWPLPVLQALATTDAYAWTWAVSLCIPLALLLFPDGTLPSQRWRPVVWVIVASSLLFAFGLGGESAVVVAERGAPAGWRVPNYTDLAPLWIGAEIIGLAVNAVVIASLVLRYRRGTPLLRRQLLWLLLAVVIFALVVPPAQVFGRGPILLFLTLALVPVAIMVAVLRHQLLDIDLVVRRSVVYGVLSLGIAAVYVALTALPGLAFGSRIPVDLAVALTIIAAVAFQPLRRRLDALADRWVFGARVDRYQLLTAFGAGLEQTLDLHDLLPTLADTVRRGLAASWVRVTLPDASSAAGEPTGLAALSVPLERGEETVGQIECGPKDGGYEPADVELLTTLAGQAATAIANVQLTAQLAERLHELARSRTRIITAQDTERRRIERDLHDGAQQHVVALITKLRLARNQLGRGERSAEDVLGELQTDARDLLADLRDLAHGIHPPVLTDRGLVAAVEARADRLPLDVAVHADPALREQRLRSDVEVAAYFTVCEALTNIVKHAHTSQAQIALSTTDGHLQIVVCDQGIGFTGANGSGHGLTNLRDRVEAVGGSLHVEAHPGTGTCVRVELPVGAPDG